MEERLHLLALYAETPGLDEHDLPLREWIARLKGPQETDAQFLLRRLGRLRCERGASGTCSTRSWSLR